MILLQGVPLPISMVTGDYTLCMIQASAVPHMALIPLDFLLLQGTSDAKHTKRHCNLAIHSAAVKLQVFMNYG